MERDADDINWDNALDQPPIEFFEAAESGKEKVADYLASDLPFTLYTRVAMALWLREKLKLPKGRPKLQARAQEATRRARLALAIWDYRKERKQQRMSDAPMRGTAEETKERIAKKYGVPLNQFEAQLHRGKQLPDNRPAWGKMEMEEIVLEMYAEWRQSRKK